MNAVTIPTLAALLLQITLGLAVYQANRRRLANQCFLLLSVTIAAWLGSLYFTFVATTSGGGGVRNSASFRDGGFLSGSTQSSCVFRFAKSCATGGICSEPPGYGSWSQLSSLLCVRRRSS